MLKSKSSSSSSVLYDNVQEGVKMLQTTRLQRFTQRSQTGAFTSEPDQIWPTIAYELLL